MMMIILKCSNVHSKCSRVSARLLSTKQQHAHTQCRGVDKGGIKGFIPPNSDHVFMKLFNVK